MSGAAAPKEAYALALASLPGCTHHRLRLLLERADFDPERAWRALATASPAGTLDLGVTTDALPGPPGKGDRDLVMRWREAARGCDVAGPWRTAQEAGIGVWLFGAPDYPRALADDPDPPPVLFWRGQEVAAGSLGAGERPAAAIVGTRRCTAYGTDVARDLGRGLAASGVSVVSGLALGVDGAAHEGALVADGAPPVGVVGSGLDVVYPPKHRRLWGRVAGAGVLVAEAPPGAAPEPWRFPRRNRILAALADVVVVVESHASGGSLSTVRAAIERGVTVMAVPGSVRSPSSAGTNRLLADGVAPVTDVEDVLVALSLEATAPAVALPRAPSAGAGERLDDPVLDAVDWTPTATEEILRRTGLSLSEAATQLHRLEAQGLLRRRGGWWERAVAPGAATDGRYTAPT